MADARVLAWPVRRTPRGDLATVTVGSDEHVLQQARLVVATRRGERTTVPDFGIGDPVGRRDVDVADVTAQVRRWLGAAADRVEVVAVPAADGSWDVAVRLLGPDSPDRVGAV